MSHLIWIYAVCNFSYFNFGASRAKKGERVHELLSQTTHFVTVPYKVNDCPWTYALGLINSSEPF